MKKYLMDYQSMLDRELAILDESNVALPDKKLILAYRHYADSQNHSLPRILRVVSILRLTQRNLSKSFVKLKREDYENLFSMMRHQGKTQGTLDTYKNVLRTFHKWLNKGSYPDCVAWFKFTRENYNGLPEDLLTQEDVKLLLQAAPNPRDKALIAVLWESGARIGEAGTLEIRNISFDEYGCQAMLNGKTGQRRIRLVSSAPYLLEWINQHPFNKKPSANLWVNQRNSKDDLICYRRLSTILDQAAKRAGIQKPSNPHHFRHSRATHMAQHLTEAQMKEYFGWKQNSDMAARYVHLSGKQVDDAILKMYGLKKEETATEELQRQPCPRCKELNDVNHQYCQKCWLPLTPQAINEVAVSQQKDQDAMATVLKLIELAKADPQILREALDRAQQKT